MADKRTDVIAKQPIDDDDNPEWTEETEARARPAEAVHPPHVVAALVKRGRAGTPG